MENMFTVTPMAQTIELEAGETYQGTIVIANPASATSDFEYAVKIAPYGVSGTDYKADFMTDANYTQIAKWIAVDNPTGTLQPNETRKITFTINVPESAPAGGQYAALMVGSASQVEANDSVAVNNVYEMASLIYADIRGETVRVGEIVENKVPEFALALPIEAKATLKNEGNVHETAKIALTVKDAFSGSTIYPAADESGIVNEVIMPETTREFVREIDGMAPLGIFDVTQTVTYMGQSSTAHHTVIVCPIWFMLLVAVTIGAVIATIVKMILKHRRKKVAV